MTKDLKSKAIADRQFLIRFGDVVKLAKQYGLVDHLSERIAIRFVNKDWGVDNSFTLITFEPHESIHIISVDNSSAAQIPPNLYLKAVELFSRLPQSEFLKWSRTKKQYFRVILETQTHKFILQKVTNTFKENFSFEQKAGHRSTWKKLSTKIQNIKQLEP